MTALMPERPQTVGNPRLHAAIVEAGLTYEELADDLRVAVKTVERWVNEPGRRPTPATPWPWPACWGWTPGSCGRP